MIETKPRERELEFLHDYRAREVRKLRTTRADKSLEPTDRHQATATASIDEIERSARSPVIWGLAYRHWSAGSGGAGIGTLSTRWQRRAMSRQS